jgi:hypothetical protein
MLLGHRYATTGGSGNNLASASLFFSQAIRGKRICYTVETTKQRLGDLCHHLKRRGYNDKVIESGLSKASEINRNNLRSTKKKGSTKVVSTV